MSCVRTPGRTAITPTMVWWWMQTLINKQINIGLVAVHFLPSHFVYFWNWKAGSSNLLCTFFFRNWPAWLVLDVFGQTESTSDQSFVRFWKWNLRDRGPPFCQAQFSTVAYAEEHITPGIAFTCTRTLTLSQRDPSRQTPSPEAPPSIATNWMCV